MEVANAFIEESIRTINNAYGRICHCVGQLGEEHIWVRQSDSLNSIGIILKHLCGNLRQWIISGIGEGQDVRNRPSEFKDEDRLSKRDLMSDFEDVIQECKSIIEGLRPTQLLEKRRIQGFEETILTALHSAITHIEFHGGQIVYMTRTLLNDKYEFRWKPTTKEEGAE